MNGSGGHRPPDPLDQADHHAVVEAFLVASRGGDLDALLDLLAPDVVRRADRFAVPSGIATEVRGARAVANETRVFAGRARTAEVALVDGAPGIVVAPHGRLLTILRVLVEGGRITEINVIADPTQLKQITLTVGAHRAAGTVDELRGDGQPTRR